MATKTLQKAEITFPSIDVGLLKELAQKYGWTVKVKERKVHIQTYSNNNEMKTSINYLPEQKRDNL